MPRVCLWLLCLLLLGPASVLAQWTEPTFTPDLMTTPLEPPPVTGTTFYVDINSIGGTCNNANAGTLITAPWCTLAKALTTLTAGQRAYVRQGTHNVGSLRPTNAGTAGNYITFERYPGDARPVLNCSGNTWCFDGRTGPPYIVWNGFDIQGPTQQYYLCWGSTGCHHIWLVNNLIHDNGALFSGLEIAGHHVILSNNEIYNTGKEGLITLSGCTNPGPSGFCTGDHIIAEFNLVHDNGREADDAGGLKCGDNDAYACVFRYNTVYENWRAAGATSVCFQPGLCQGVTGLYIDRGRENTLGGISYIYNNIVYNNDIGIQAYDSQSVYIFNNVVYHNGFQTTWNENWGRGITIPGGGQNVDLRLYNNTVYNNRTDGVYYQSNIGGGFLHMRNNIIFNNGGLEITVYGGTNEDVNNDLILDNVNGGDQIRWFNSYYPTLSAFLARGGNTSWLNAVGTAPTFVAPGNTGSANYRLQTGSNGVNQGASVSSIFTYDLDNVTRPQGGTWDMGAYEFVVAASAPPTVTITTNGGAGAGVDFATAGTPLSPILEGTASDDVAVSSVTWACPTCTPTSGTATGTTSWSVATIGLAAGANVLTVTATDGDSQTAQDTLTVTYTIVTSVPPVLRLVR